MCFYSIILKFEFSVVSHKYSELFIHIFTTVVYSKCTVYLTLQVVVNVKCLS